MNLMSLFIQLLPQVGSVLIVVLAALSNTAGIRGEVIASGPFQPTVESLSKYGCPEWFRDAKFGIYVHWGVYSVAERGEWYAREMYQEGSNVYKHHVATWGHPSQFGYHDFIPKWKAEKFDADAWLALFKEAGAKYFTPCAVHHDGFALWDSQFTPYNAANMGPKQDLLAMMRDATLRHGLRWGVTTHYDRSINWLQPVHGADKEGPLKGVPYLKQDPLLADLYLFPYYDGNRADTLEAPTWWKELWLIKQKELIDKYEPDYLYLDSAVPFAGSDRGRTGMRLFAYFYNSNMARHSGQLEAVVTHKGDKGPLRAPYFADIATLDIERGKSGRILPQPWQTDDSIGPWGYNTTVRYKDVNAVVDKLIDIVSKNGNLLLNVPPKADGTLDDDTVAILKGIGAWLKFGAGPKGSLRRTSLDAGIPAIIYEAGGVLTLELDEIERGVTGVHNVMRHLGMIEAGGEPPHPATVYNKTCWLRVPPGAAGMFLTRLKVGDEVRRGDQLGTVVDPFSDKETPITSADDGVIIGMERPNIVYTGDALFHLGLEKMEL